MEWHQTFGSKYGLQLRTVAAAKKPPRPKPVLGFGDDDADGDVEEQIARQASKKKALRDVEQQHKRALEEDPNIFDYDGIYDQMKEEKTRCLKEDQKNRESKYIHKLVEKAKVRAQEHDIVYERQLAKERSKEDHLFGDKEKFLTSAYKKKLAEQAKWLEEERLRELREKADEVTNKSDMSDFYRNLLSKNVAFGAQKVEYQKKTTIEKEESRVQDTSRHGIDPSFRAANESESFPYQEKLATSHDTVSDGERLKVSKCPRNETTNISRADTLHDLQATASVEAVPSISKGIADSQIEPEAVSTTSTEAKPENSGKVHADSLLAAKERYLARKKMRES